MATVATVSDYYADPVVLRRMLQYLGGRSVEEVSACYVTGEEGEWLESPEPGDPRSLPALLQRGCDISRSLWDRRFLVADLDIEYVNFDFPAEPYLNPLRSFAAQRAVVEAIRQVLEGSGIRPLHLVTGRGHHFVWQIRRDSRVCARLEQLGRVPESVGAYYDMPRPPGGEVPGRALGRAWAGLGLLLEYIAHRVRTLAAPRSTVPVQLCEVRAGQPGRGLEIISLDVSEFGDTIDRRRLRVPFTVYRKPEQQRAVLGEEYVRGLPPLFVLPAGTLEDDVPELLAIRTDPTRARDHAITTGTRIPDCTGATEMLLGEYTASPLARVHDAFYAQEQHPPELWAETYDRLAPGTLPPCVRAVLQNPNDLLLRPVMIRMVVRALLADGWHPRHIAGLIRSRYERDYNWGFRWFGSNAVVRADFYTRLFAGLARLGRDDLDDFSCQGWHAPEETPRCQAMIAALRQQLLRTAIA